MKKTLISLALCHALPAQTDASSGLWLPLIPASGDFSGRDGRGWTVDDAEAIIANTERPFILDADHTSENGDDTSASGWFTDLKVEDDFIKGFLGLNSRGQTAIADKQYKYYSPAFLVDPKTNAVVALVSVGLTNKPNLDVPALNSESATDLTLNQEETTMLNVLLAALGVAADADQQTALNAVQKLKNQGHPDLDSYVPKATFEQMQTELNTAKKQLADIAKSNHNQAVEVAINAAIADKKIAPADKEYFVDTCATEEGLESFRQFVANRPPVIGDVGLPKEAPKGGEVALNVQERAVYQQLNIDPSTLKETE